MGEVEGVVGAAGVGLSVGEDGAGECAVGYVALAEFSKGDTPHWMQEGHTQGQTVSW